MASRASELGGGSALAPAGGRALLAFREVCAGYGGADILHEVSFDVPEGGLTCVVGPNGAGKSTLLGTVSGIVRTRLGELHFRGKPLRKASPRERLERGIVQVPQNHSLFREMTVRENVELGGFILRDRALVRQRYEQIAETIPVVAQRAKDKAGSLSGGQQRLVEFARCLMLDPDLVVLDEPSMGLDPRTRKTVFDTIRTLHRGGRTILLVEQNARAGLRLATHGVVLENGRVRLEGSGREVLEHPEIGALFLGGSPPPDLGVDGAPQ
ncbi:MAG TPA: ABC transporter ATP-binding protein [Acidimicrobiales bacterium]|nr:ABC transporter ATP-binding protein [Acidimicrobiales bacterium]